MLCKIIVVLPVKGQGYYHQGKKCLEFESFQMQLKVGVFFDRIGKI